MAPATDTDVKAFFDRFNQMTEAEQDALIGSGRRIQSVEDLDGLDDETMAWLRPIIEAATSL